MAAANPSAHPSAEPLVLIVPGLNDSGPGHWQSLWERDLPYCSRVDLGMWDNPHRNTWVNKLNLAIDRAGRPVILVAHSLGCLAVAWWAEYERPALALHNEANPVIGALLVAPPDVDRPGIDPRVAHFGAAPRGELPFPAFLVASSNDPWCHPRTAAQLAQDWGCRFAVAGDVGHINAESGLGDWPFGKLLLRQLIGRSALRALDAAADHTPVVSGTGLRPERN